MHTVDHPNGLQTWRFGFDGDGVVAAITTRHGGRSTGPYASLNLGLHVGDDDDAVLANRALVCEALGVDRLTVADQQHGCGVRRVPLGLAGAGHESLEDARRRLGNTDALVTDLPGVALSILVADCAPVVLFDPRRRALGVAHVGRRGADLDVIGVAVEELIRAFGCTPSSLLAGIGPCIGATSYEIGEVEAKASAAALGADLLVPTRPGHACFDLLGAVRRRLEQAGIPPGNVDTADIDTYETTADLFSDRRERPCGRFMLVASLLSS